MSIERLRKKTNGKYRTFKNIKCGSCDINGLDPECEDCLGDGVYEVSMIIPWITLKRIYADMSDEISKILRDSLE